MLWEIALAPIILVLLLSSLSRRQRLMIETSTTWPEIIAATATAVGSVGVIAALTYTARQTHALRNQANLQREESERNVEVQRANLELRLIELTISIDKLFLERPHLRPYFYGNRKLRWWERRKRRVEVIATAEVMIDFVDAIASLGRHGQISERDYQNWRVFTESYYQQSPAVRELWNHWGKFYMDETAELFEERNGPSKAHTEPGGGRLGDPRKRLALFTLLRG